MLSTALLQIASLTKFYGEQLALEDVGFSVQAGEILGRIGPNGAGKTTLLEAIAGLLPVDSGEIRFRDRPLPAHRRREVIFYLPDGIVLAWWRSRRLPPNNRTFLKEIVMNSSTKTLLIIAVSVIAVLLPAFAAPIKVDLTNETVGAEPKELVPVVGVWRIENDGGKKVLAVDGRQWKEGQSSAGIADKARALYGERYAEFLDRVQAYAYYPYVVAKDVENFKNGEITVRFECLSGRIIRVPES